MQGDFKMSNSFAKAVGQEILVGIIWHTTAYVAQEMWKHSPKVAKVAILAASVFLLAGALTGNPFIFTAGVALGSLGLMASIIAAIYANCKDSCTKY